MSKRNDNSDICMCLMAIWTMLMLMTMSQCQGMDGIRQELLDIKHEVTMLKYK